MSATERIRAMLDERGVEWTVPDESWNQDSITYWKVGSIKWVAFESENDTLWLNCNSVTDLTPEQAIAATLGVTDARPTQAESSGTCHDEGDPSDFCCSECGVRMFTNTSDTYTMIASDGRTIIKRPNYCPNCGRRCVG